MEQTETLDERKARYRSGQWTWLDPYPTQAWVTVNKYGGKKRKGVYRGHATRWDGKTQLREFCDHNHVKRAQAEICSRRLARELNRDISVEVNNPAPSR